VPAVVHDGLSVAECHSLRSDLSKWVQAGKGKGCLGGTQSKHTANLVSGCLLPALHTRSCCPVDPYTLQSCERPTNRTVPCHLQVHSKPGCGCQRYHLHQRPAKVCHVDSRAALRVCTVWSPCVTSTMQSVALPCMHQNMQRATEWTYCRLSVDADRPVVLLVAHRSALTTLMSNGPRHSGNHWVQTGHLLCHVCVKNYGCLDECVLQVCV
jgi:hypothetical protein